ncbi:hypothetical protein [Streptomyces niveus]|uniref:hypothetical protein n=1 Tax=Streptomyces niveus TaxID=193462 RepID=UPI0034282A7A
MPYATVPQLTDWLDPEPTPATAVRLLEQASDSIDVALYGVAYDVDDPDVLAVLAKACVRQVHWMVERGDDTGALADVQSMTAGKRSFARFARSGDSGAVGTPKLCDAAVDVLRVAGLLTFYPLVVG